MPDDRSVRKVGSEQRTAADSTPGMVREEAIAEDGMWSGLVRTAPGMASGWHHHGEHQTSIYVAAGRLRLESGPGGRDVIEAAEGDFVHVPAGVIHRETNPGGGESRLVVVRAGAGPTTINVEGPDRPST